VAILTNNVALVTGAGRGIGRAIAISLAQHGARVALVDNGSSIDGSGSNPDLVGITAGEIAAQGGSAMSLTGDVTSGVEVENLVSQVEKEWDGIDMVVNAAGNMHLGTIRSTPDDVWDSLINVHLRGTMMVTRAVVGSLLRRGSPGRIVNFTSLAGTAGLPNEIAYATCKAGVIGLTKALANELFHAGITANAISPGYSTRMAFRGSPAHYQRLTHSDTATTLAETSSSDQLSRPELDPANIGPLIVYLGSDAAASVTGRVFGANGRRYSRLSEMVAERSVISPGGWTVEDLAEIFPSTLGEGLHQPEYWLESLDVVSDTEVSAERVEREYVDVGRTR
jgi:NAD(P)-dependent dehydrogenase (short-subunit alcohol dehydrogenase family)